MTQEFQFYFNTELYFGFKTVVSQSFKRPSPIYVRALNLQQYNTSSKLHLIRSSNCTMCGCKIITTWPTSVDCLLIISVVIQLCINDFRLIKVMKIISVTVILSVN